MITICPKDICLNKSIFIAQDNGKDLGNIIIEHDKNSVKIIDLTVLGHNNGDCLDSENKQLVESLLKAVAGYAMNRNIFLLKLCDRLYGPFAEKFGFVRQGNEMIMDLYKIINPCNYCSKHI